MEFYRVEHKESKDGPYSEIEWEDGLHDLENGRPGPWEDNILSKQLRNKGWDYISYRFRFGFENLKDLHYWFKPTELENLAEKGYHIKKYRVRKENVIIGGYQAILILDNEEE